MSEKLTSIARKVAALRSHGSCYFTNAYFSASKLASILDMQGTCVKHSGNSVVVLTSETGFVRLFLHLSSIECLEDIKPLLAGVENPIICEVVGKEEGIEAVSGAFVRSGWSVHNSLLKMSRPPQQWNSAKAVSIVEPARDEDVPHLQRLLYLTFDPMTSHLPSLDQLRESVGKSEVSLIRCPDGIAALSIFERLGRRSKYLFQLAVDTRYRRMGYASALLSFEFSRGDPNDQYSLWVELGNTPALELYERFGFACTGQQTRIFRYDGGTRCGHNQGNTAGPASGV